MGGRGFRHSKELRNPRRKKKSVKNYLNSLRKNKGADLLVLPFYRKSVADPTTVADWYGWFVNQREYMDFDAIVSERNIVGAVNYEEIIGDCEGWSVPPTVRVDRNPEAIVAALIPILRFGTCITIIDQFLSWQAIKFYMSYWGICQTSKILRS